MAVTIEARPVWLTGWLFVAESPIGGRQPEVRALTNHLYGDDAYRLQQEIGGWLRVMKGAIAKSASFFNSHRMMRRYATEAYLR